MAKVKISRGLQANYDAIQTKDGDTIYVCTDTGLCYLGNILLSPTDTSANMVFLNGRTGNYQLFQYALCACDDSVSGAVWNMVPLATSGGTGSKTANYNAKFPIGCSIYYHPETEAYAANTDFSGKAFYTTYDEVDARYTAINPTGLNLHNSSTSDVFLHVNVDDGYWSPYYKADAVNEIIVTSNSLASGNFYIYLGKTSGDTTYKFQLESNHPLYYYDGTQLVDYATWIASQNAPQFTYEYKKFDMQYQEITSGGLIVYDWASSTLNSLSNGTYKVTVQRHAYSSVIRPSVLHMTLRYGGDNSWVGISASTSIIPAAIQTQDEYDPLGSITVVMVGFLTLGDQRNNLQLVQEGVSGLCFGGELPYGGSCIESVVVNDFVLLEKIG